MMKLFQGPWRWRRALPIACVVYHTLTIAAYLTGLIGNVALYGLQAPLLGPLFAIGAISPMAFNLIATIPMMLIPWPRDSFGLITPGTFIVAAGIWALEGYIVGRIIEALKINFKLPGITAFVYLIIAISLVGWDYYVHIPGLMISRYAVVFLNFPWFHIEGYLDRIPLLWQTPRLFQVLVYWLIHIGGASLNAWIVYLIAKRLSAGTSLPDASKEGPSKPV